MSMVLEDVGGSFKRFLKNAVPTFRKQLASVAVKGTSQAIKTRMVADAPEGPEAPHLKDAIDIAQHGTMALIGILDGTQPAAPGSTATMAEVALYNEYSPNHQPFMRPAAEAENSAFTKRAANACQAAERDLSI
jgi:hypothetical protein